MSNEGPPKVEKCYCGCGGSTKGHFKQGHDKRALSFVVQAEYGSTEAFLKVHGYEPGQAADSSVALNEYGSIAAFLSARGYGPEGNSKPDNIPDTESESRPVTTNAKADYQNQAWDFLYKSKRYLEEGDLHQASEKGWGAAAHMMKAVCSARGWNYDYHDEFRERMRDAGQWLRMEKRMLDLRYVADALHSNYYQRRIFLHADEITQQLEDMEQMLTLLQPLTE